VSALVYECAGDSSPLTKLKDALSSKEAFSRRYLVSVKRNLCNSSVLKFPCSSVIISLLYAA